jgi:hypothetical protein
MAFQAPQSGHCPAHFGCPAPQALQTKAARVFFGR